MNHEKSPLTLDQVLRDGIDHEGWLIYRSAPKELNDDLFASMLKHHSLPEGGRFMWLVGKDVGQRLHNRNILGCPRDFVHTDAGWDKVIGHVNHNLVWAFESHDKCQPDLLRVIVITANNIVVDSAAQRIDTDLEG